MIWDDLKDYLEAEDFAAMVEELIESGQILTDTNEEGHVTLYASE